MRRRRTDADDDTWEADEWDNSDQPTIAEFDMERWAVEKRMRWYLALKDPVLDERGKTFFQSLGKWRGKWTPGQHQGGVKSLRRAFMQYLNRSRGRS